MTNKEKPVFGTTEWAASNVNIIKGCSNDCKYCFSKEMAIRFKRKTPDNWKQEEVNLEAFNKNPRYRDGYIMFPSTHDISPEHLDLAIDFLKRLLGVGNKVLIVSKPSYPCIKQICDTFTEYKDQILFRFTIGSCSSKTLRFWEPNAPDYEERKRALVYAFEAGYQKSSETVVCLRGRLVEEFYQLVQGSGFKVQGSDFVQKVQKVQEIELSPNGPNVALNIPVGQWHTVRALESGTVILECKDGAYEPLADVDVLSL